MSTSIDTLLEIHNLSISYLTPRGHAKALRDVNLIVPRGKIVGIVGESGCGKSTLIASIIRLLSENAIVESGRIDFDTQDLLQASQVDMQQLLGDRIATVFQDPMSTLNPVRSIGAHMVDIQYREKISTAEKRERAIAMLDLVGIPDPASRLEQYPHQFSGGMRQRIAIAMALQASPDLLIADEPTTALDATLEVQIIHLLKDLQSTIGCSVLFISHHLGVIAELCDYVAVMYAGEVVEYGTVRDIFQRPGHPYTCRLLECDPAHIKTASRTLPTIPGDLPNLVDLPAGCIFANRCTDVMPSCQSARPEDRTISNGHTARCVLSGAQS